MDENPYKSLEDEWLAYLYVMLGCCCERCGVEPDLEWAWRVAAPGISDEADVFAINATRYLLRAGWRLIDHIPYCANCAARSQAGT